MNQSELKRLKMAWLAAREAGDTKTQISLLRDHSAEQALTDFVVAYHASGGDVQLDIDEPVLSLTQKAFQRTLDRVFESQVASLTALREQQKLSKSAVAKGLRLSVDVWNKFENGAIELVSLSQKQVERFALFFQVSADQFANLLNNSQPAYVMNRRQSREAARSEQQGPQKQSFEEAIARSSMSKADRKFWLEEE